MKVNCKKCNGIGTIKEPNAPERNECEFCNGTGEVEISPGDSVRYIHDHFLNSKSVTILIKEATFLRESKGKALIKVHKNKNNSRVLPQQLYH